MPSSRRFSRHVVLALCTAAVMGLADVRAIGDDYRFPPEWAPQAAIWIAWQAFGSPENTPDGQFQRAAASVKAKMIKELLSSNRVVLLVNSDLAQQQATGFLGDMGIDLAKIDFYRAPTEEYFIRDVGPRFLSNGASLKIADIPWTCFGYSTDMVGDYHAECLERGGNDGAIAQAMGLDTLTPKAVSEGGGLDTTSTMLMGYLDTAMQRNPGMTQAAIEADYLATYGKQKMLWLKKSPISDRPGYKAGRYFGWGANGHVDEYVRFANDTTILIAQIDGEDATDPLIQADYEALKSNLEDVKAARTVDGQPFTIIEMPAADPTVFAYEVRINQAPYLPQSWADTTDLFSGDDPVLFVPAVSYLNFVISNDKILVAQYWSEGLPESVRTDDQQAAETLAQVFPNRKVVGINPLAINYMGGGMHCATQQQPAVSKTAAIAR